MNDLALKTIADYGMLSQGDTVVVGVSGGADSMALLHFLHTYVQKLGILVIAAHVNHMLRGDDANQDEAHVRQWCLEHSVPFRCARYNVAACAKEKGISLEACGREMRYAFFETLAEEYDSKIATAHTLSDSMETVLFHMVRGTGIKGLRGIPPVRGRVIRPFIRVERWQTERYCSENQIVYRSDSSNFDNTFSRNRIRNLVIPELKYLNPALPRALEGLMRRAAADDDYLESLAAQLLRRACGEGGYDCGQLKAAAGPVRTRALRMAAAQAGSDCEEVHVTALERLLQKGMGRADLPGNVEARCWGGALSFAEQSQIFSECLWMELQPPQTVFFGGKKFIVQVLPLSAYKNDTKIYKMLLTNGVNYDTISGSIVLRNRREGDRFSPAGRGVTKTLKKLFQEAGMSPERRSKAAILECSGKLLWIEGFGVSEQAKIREGVQRALVVLPEEEFPT